MTSSGGQVSRIDNDRRLRLLVVIHHLSVGGSQRCAVDLACGVHGRGHDVTVAGPPGPLADLLVEAGVPFVPLEGDKPGQALGQALPGYRRLLDLTRELHPQLVHSYELTPSILTYLGAHLRDRTPMTMTINSMSVPDFMPPSVPLQVCSPLIASEVHERIPDRPGPVGVLEIPTDTTDQYPGYPGAEQFRARLGIAPDEQMIVVVSRFARALKQEGLETAIRAAARLAPHHPRMRLVLVGDGPAMPDLRRQANRANIMAGREAVILTGELVEPRPAYSAADIVLGMGGSLLRAMAFGKPCIVQGEHGFFRILDADSARDFRWRGFFGIGGGNGESLLVDLIERLLVNPELRKRNADFALGLVHRHYSLDKAVDEQIAWYHKSLERAVDPSRREAAKTVAAIGAWFTERAVKRPTGREKSDYFNSPERTEPGMRAPVPHWFDPDIAELIGTGPFPRPAVSVPAVTPEAAAQ